jgi:ABC-type transport system substrate-binding protein/DNA-binding SARP family transcriptional activator/DNA-binding beta-propeller fold protein YncE
MAVVFRVLGPLEVWFDGAPVKIGGARQRALLAMLLLHANRVVSREQLIDELLSDARPETADHTLRVQVSRLRSVVDRPGASEPRLVRQVPGYRLRVNSGELDLDVFEELVAQAHEASGNGDHELASRTLREAEALWRGRPLADLDSKRFAQLEIERLAEMRLVATEDRIDAELALGRHRRLVPELERMVAEHPLRERVRGQAMMALYRSGRQADALAAYRTGRACLVDQLGVEPGPALRDLERAILRQDVALEQPQSASPRPSGEPTADVAVIVDEPVVVAPSARAPASSRGGHRRVRREAIVAVAVAAIALVAFLAAAGMAPVREPRLRPERALTGDGLALVSPADGALKATVPLRAAPSDMVAGFGSLWVTEGAAGDVVRIDPNAHRVLARIPLGASPSRIVAGGGAVWVLDPISHTASAIDPATDTVAQTIAVSGGASDVTFDAGSLWILDGRSATVSRFDPDTGLRRSTIGVGGHPSKLTAIGDGLWVTDDKQGLVHRIDPHEATLTQTLRVGGAPAAIAATDAGIWVVDRLAATVSRLRSDGRTVGSPVELGGAPNTLTSAGGHLWVGDERHGTVLGLDPRTMSVRTRIQIGGGISSLATDHGLWVAVLAPAVRPGGRLTAVGSYAGLDTVDPAASTSWNPPPPQSLGLTNDGLVTLDHIAGPDGSRLVPDLALALPTPEDGGRTYRFTLRPGIRYSSGAAVRPSDVPHSFERLFAIGSAGATLYTPILGAAACIRTPIRCDLSHGIVADDQTGIVSFHLTQPDPDFLYKLTVSYAYILPATTPKQQARAPLPATGPYLITRYLPGRELRLIRNPYFHEWSAAAQPAGFPDRITIPLGLSPAQAESAIAGGHVDFDPNLGQLPGRQARDLLVDRRVQVEIHPSLGTGFMFLNTKAPPFTQVGVRRALNLAYDRSAAVEGWGGTLAAKPTCQLLPPAIPGYRRYCPDTSHPGVDGGWRGTNLARAKRLVAASGTRGMRVVVWNSNPSPPGSVAETRLAVTALRRLGYRASLRRLPGSTYFSYTGDSRNRAQVIDGGFGADFASASDFIGKFACGEFVARDGLDTTDDSEFCSTQFDRQVEDAASLQTTQPAAADRLWNGLDRKLTDLAVLVPTVTPNEVDVVSHHIHDYQYNPVWGALLDQLSVR